MNNTNHRTARPESSRSLARSLGCLARDRRGATVVEYLVIVGLIAIACIALFQGQFFGAISGAVGGQSGQIQGLGTN